MEPLVNLRVEQTNDKRSAVLADITGGPRVLLGYLAEADTHLQIGGADRVAKAIVPVKL